MELSGRRAVVTGAGRRNGLGRAIALALARNGADVVVGYLAQDRPAKDLATEIEELGRRSAALQADLRQRASCEQLIQDAVNFLGGVDILVNNAGTNYVGPFLDLPPGEWDSDRGINLDAVFHCSQFAAREMIRGGHGGGIVVVSSSAASIVGPGLSHYSAAKAGAEMLARSMAYELAPHAITVNVVAPGPAGPTDLNRQFFLNPGDLEKTEEGIPLGRLASPDDVANAVAYAVSPKASYMTGAKLMVDGGYSLGKSQN